MGMYTEFHFNSMLRKDVPIDVIDTLNYMVSNDDKMISNFKPKQNHQLFKTERWDSMLIQDSYYFDADTHSTLRFDEIANAYYLCIRCNFINHNNEIELFIDWIKPYLWKDDDDFLGFYRYEETENPTLIFH